MARQVTPRKPASDQLLVRKLGPLKQRLRRRAQRHGHSMEQEVRDILHDALKDEGKPEKGLGTQIAERFRGLGLKEEDFPRIEIDYRIPNFDE